MRRKITIEMEIETSWTLSNQNALIEEALRSLFYRTEIKNIKNEPVTEKSNDQV